MADFLKIEDLPKNYQLYFNQLKSMGYDDIRRIYIHTFTDGTTDLNFWVWIDVEDMIDGKIKPIRQLRFGLENDAHPKYFGIDSVNYTVRYKNKQKFADKILPDLKKILKSSEYGPLISSIRFNTNEDFDEPKVTVIIKKNIRLTWESSNKVSHAILDVLDKYKQEHGLIRLDTFVK